MPLNEEKLSLVVPVYNVANYLSRCIESIVSQTYSNLEIILIDDGSTDGSSSICDEWQKRDARIRVIHKPNGGLSSARNCGLATATGAFVGFIDGDDSVDFNMYESMMNEFLPSVDVVSCGKTKVYTNRSIKTQNVCSRMSFDKEDGLNELLKGFYMDESFCDKVFRKSILNNVKFPEGEINEDLPTIIKVFDSISKVTIIPGCFYLYHQNEGSITRSGYGEKYHIVIKHLKDIEGFLNKYPAIKEVGFRVLQARYSIGMLSRLYTDKTSKINYRDDFLYFRELLRRNARIYKKVYNPSFFEKICIWSMSVGVYPLLIGIYRFGKRN